MIQQKHMLIIKHIPIINSYYDINHPLFSIGSGTNRCGFLENQAKNCDPWSLCNFTCHCKFDQLDLYYQ